MPEPNIGPPTHTPSSGPFITHTLEVAFVVLEDDDDLPYHLKCWRRAFFVCLLDFCLFVYWLASCLFIGFWFWFNLTQSFINN